MRQILLLISTLLYLDIFGQTDTSELHFDSKIIEVDVSLNNDKLEDKVIISQDTLSETAPYRLQIFFRKPDGDYKLIVSTNKAIEPQYPNGRDGYRTGTSFLDITFTKNALSLNTQLLRGHYEYTFRYQHRSFELVEFTMVNSNGLGTEENIEFNFLTGIRVAKTIQYDTDKVSNITKQKILIRPLPKLQDFVPMSNEYY